MVGVLGDDLELEVGGDGCGASGIGGAVGAAVIGDDDLAGELVVEEELRRRGDVAGDLVGFVEGGDDDRQLGRAAEVGVDHVGDRGGGAAAALAAQDVVGGVHGVILRARRRQGWRWSGRPRRR